MLWKKPFPRYSDKNVFLHLIDNIYVTEDVAFLLTDAFLHQIHSGTANLRFLVERVNDIMKHKVEATIANIRAMIFFDYKLAFSRTWVNTMQNTQKF